MSTPLNVLVTGYGNLGAVLLRTLTAEPFKSKMRVFLLVRPASYADPAKRATIDQFTPLGVTLLQGDAENTPVPELTTLLRNAGIHAIVSVVGFQQLVSGQLSLIQAAKAAGVDRYFPSEFGVDGHAMGKDATTGPLGQLITSKMTVQDAVKESGLAQTIVLNGGFAEFIVNTPMFGVKVPERATIAPGSFDTVITLTSLKDVAAAVGYALLDPATRNASIHIGEPLSYGQITDALEAATGAKFTRTVRTKAEAQAMYAANPYDFEARFAEAFMDGKGMQWPANECYLKKKHSDYKTTDFATLSKQMLQGK